MLKIRIRRVSTCRNHVEQLLFQWKKLNSYSLSRYVPEAHVFSRVELIPACVYPPGDFIKPHGFQYPMYATGIHIPISRLCLIPEPQSHTLISPLGIFSLVYSRHLKLTASTWKPWPPSHRRPLCFQSPSFY